MRQSDIKDYTVIPKDTKKPYEFYNSELSDPSYRNIHIIADTTPMEDWYIAEVGICALNGKFYLINSRPQNYSAFSYSEVTIKEISYEEFVSRAGEAAKGITKENALSHIPKELYKELYEEIESQQAPKTIEISSVGEYQGNCPDLYSLHIRENLRFGLQEVRLQKYDTGYRVSLTVKSWFNDSKTRINDRLINDDDYSYICSFIPDDFVNENGSDFAVKNISVYGGEQFYASGVLCDGTEFNFANFDYCQKLQDALIYVAKGPIKIKQ